MIRTRDLVFFLTCLVVLALAILFTLARQQAPTWSVGFDVASIPEFVSGGGVTTGSETAVDRAANVARLREKLALDTSSITPQPDTFVEDIPITETDAPQAPTHTVDRCLYPDDVLPRIAAWPMGHVRVAVEGSYRVAYSESAAAMPTSADEASTTTEQAAEMVRTTYLALPVVPTALPVASCVPSEVVGVTGSGILLLNSDAAIWRNVDSESLIGYARDGYPIYGRYEGEVDECGGYLSGTGYRYSIGAERPFMIGCFKATPQSFTF